jgi:hypothetical protein
VAVLSNHLIYLKEVSLQIPDLMIAPRTFPFLSKFLEAIGHTLTLAKSNIRVKAFHFARLPLPGPEFVRVGFIHPTNGRRNGEWEGFSVRPSRDCDGEGGKGFVNKGARAARLDIGAGATNNKDRRAFNGETRTWHVSRI